MQVTSYTAIRAHPAKTMRRTCDYQAPLIITRGKAPPVALLSREVYGALSITQRRYHD